MEHGLIEMILFISGFLIFTGLLQKFTSKISFLPYTVALLLAGIIGQFLVAGLHLDLELKLSTDIIYYILLPLLLFESAFHINFHQFRLQFKTITFIATFGLLVSIFAIGYFLAFAIGYPLPIAILFGAIISATDPIAVISLFKTLGAPKRLGLVADGESMLNDATGVIAFKVVSSFVIASTVFQSHDLLNSAGTFTYVFVGSIIFGAIVGYLFSKVIERISNDRIIETTMTVAAALGSFVAAEHFFQLSGVIATVITGIVVGNLGKTKFSPGVREFVEEFWSYFAFLSVSLVFFFATFNLDFSIFSYHPQNIAFAILAVLIGRAISVYGSVFITNYTPFFKDEPNIPMSWQHILNWGGLRGVIPLVLVYSLPENFAYRNDMLSFTMGAFLFTLLINGLTIRSLLLWLGVHLPKKEEEVLAEELSIFELEEAKASLARLKDKEFDPDMLLDLKKELNALEEVHKKHLLKIATPADFEKSLRLQSLHIERRALDDLYHQGYVSENIYFDFDSELDLQQDALEYPEVYSGGAIKEGGTIDAHAGFRKRIARLRNLAAQFPILKSVFKSSREQLIQDRLGLLKARIITSEMVIDYLVKMESYLKSIDQTAFIKSLIQEHKSLIQDNNDSLTKLTKENINLIQAYQRKLAYNLIAPTHHTH
ncbi:Na+/H+ antiporter [soil metagenome]